MTKLHLYVGVAIAAVSLGFPALASARQVAATPGSEAGPQPDAGQASTLDEVVVTARRRSESAQKVPVAVSAFGVEQMERQDIRDSADIARRTPSLYLGGGAFSGSSTTISLRGITTPGSNVTFDPTIGIYVDDIYLTRNYGTLFDYVDVANVQVLRGVQGTLFGRNNTGGAVLISTASPKPFNEGALRIGYGNYNDVRVDAMANIVIAPDVLSSRFAVMTTSHDGYGTNVVNGQGIGDRNAQTYRASFLLTPTPNSEFKLTYEYGQHDQSGPILLPRAPAGRVLRTGLGFYDAAYDTRMADFGHDQRLTGNGRIEFGSVTAKLILGHLSGIENTFQDIDATDSSTATLLPIRVERVTDHTQDSAEFQLSGVNFGDRLNWVGGLYYLTEDAYQPTVNPTARTQQQLYIDNQSSAVFGHVDYDITSKLQFGGGLRYTQDQKSVEYGVFNQATSVCVPASTAVRASPGYDTTTCRVTVGKDASYYSWDATVNYQLTGEALLYARAGRGQKSGGFNSTINNAADLVGYNPEIATDYELGLKTQWFDRHLTVNGALYQTDYADIQRSRLVLIGTSTSISVENAAQARIRGAEIEMNLRLDNGLSVDANYSYVDPKFTQFLSRDAAGNVVDQSNFPFATVAKNQFGLNVGYERELSGLGRVLGNVSYSYRSRYAVVPIIDPELDQPAYALVGGRISFIPQANPDVEIALWGRNLSDEQYVTAGTSSSAVRFVTPGTPRTFGVELKMRFGG